MVSGSLTRKIGKILGGIAGAIVLALLLRAAIVTTHLPRGIRYANTFTSPQDFFSGIFRADRQLPLPTTRLGAVIVPHHLVASESIAGSIKMLTRQKPHRIILLSPDHYHVCRQLACSTSGTFETIFGPVNTSSSGWEELLIGAPDFSDQPDLFIREHGIYTILPFIAYYLPGTQIVPIALATDRVWSAAEQNRITQVIARLINRETVVVISSDFSHYLPLREADQMDEKTIQTLMSKDLVGLAHLNNPSQSDCPPCLTVLARLADQFNFYHPVILSHTNSARLLDDLTVPSTTSHYSIAWSFADGSDANVVTSHW